MGETIYGFCSLVPVDWTCDWYNLPRKPDSALTRSSGTDTQRSALVPDVSEVVVFGIVAVQNGRVYMVIKQDDKRS